MNNDFTDLEADLLAFQPRPPSRALEDRLGRALDALQVAGTRVRWWQQLGFQRPLAAFTWALATPAAAVCAVLLLHIAGAASPVSAGRAERAESAERPGLTPLASAQASAGGFEPARASNVVVQTNDEGVVYDADQQPAHQMRYRSRETLAWRNPHTGAQVEVSYPQEEVVVTPISLR